MMNFGFVRPWTQTGQHGVTLFFVLSGFLITSKLIEAPNLRRFYIRRFFRLMPVAWCYLAFLAIFDFACGGHLLSLKEAAACVFFYRNYFDGASTGAATHFWSLSMEEQFYLVWPCLLVFAAHKKCRWIAAAGALACAVYRFVRWNQCENNFHFHTEVRADALLIGCLLALAFADVRFRASILRWSNLLWVPALMVMILCFARFHWLTPLYEDLSIATLIAASLDRSALARIMSAQWLAWLGTVSYSVYVWQSFFLLDRPYPQKLIMMALMPFFAFGSYYFIEKPFLRFGHRASYTLQQGMNAYSGVEAFVASTMTPMLAGLERSRSAIPWSLPAPSSSRHKGERQ